MDVAVQFMMGISLAACAGLRAFLPLLVASLLARSGYVALSDSYGFLVRDDVIVILVVATVAEILGDKFMAMDHVLDAIGTVVRPAVGAMLASSMLVAVDPAMSVFLGLIVGGSTTFLVHSGKALTRYKSTVLAPLHGGVGNAAISIVEDLAAIVGVAVAFLHPVIAFVLAVGLVVLAVWSCLSVTRLGIRFVGCLLGRRRTRVVQSPVGEASALKPIDVGVAPETPDHTASRRPRIGTSR